MGFPASSETEYEILRALIERDLIPEDVTVQVLVQAREHLIRRTFEAIQGAKKVIIHFYNSTSTLQRRVVFHTDMEGVIQIAVDGARLIRRLTEEHMAKEDVDIRYEYSPESFSGTEPGKRRCASATGCWRSWGPRRSGRPSSTFPTPWSSPRPTPTPTRWSTCAVICATGTAP